jgi:hypothetical protein
MNIFFRSERAAYLAGFLKTTLSEAAAVIPPFYFVRYGAGL